MSTAELDKIPQTTQDFLPFRELLYRVVVENKYQKVLETGTDVGDSTRILSTALQVTGGNLVSADIAPPKDSWHEKWPVKNVQFFTGDARSLRLKEEIDLLFLDDDHSYEQVKAELVELGVWVRVGGKIMLHDAGHDKFGEGIRKAVWEFCHKYQLVYSMYPHGSGMAIIEVTHKLR